MPTYEYIARTTGGEEVTGLMQAENETAVARTLDERDLFPVRVGVQTGARSARKGRRVRTRDVGVMYSQLSDLLSAGVPMLRALETLARATPNPRLKRVVLTVREEVAGGESLADAATKHPEVFTSLHSAMIRAGERASFLEDVLANLAAFTERQDELRNKVRGAMIYPAILTVFGTIAVIVMLTVFVPKFDKFFSGIDQPLPTRMLFVASRALTGYWLPLLAGLIATGFAVVAVLRSERGRATWSRWQLKLPVLGKLLRIVGISRFCRILGTMLHNGVPILQALDISKDATGNVLLAECVHDAAESVRGGQPLADPLRQSRLFPEDIVEMISVGEESNQLEKVLVQTANKVDQRTSRQLEQAVRLVEPLILVLIAGAVGLIAVGLLYPIFTMADRLQ